LVCTTPSTSQRGRLLPLDFRTYKLGLTSSTHLLNRRVARDQFATSYSSENSDLGNHESFKVDGRVRRNKTIRITIPSINEFCNYSIGHAVDRIEAPRRQRPNSGRRIPVKWKRHRGARQQRKVIFCEGCLVDNPGCSSCHSKSSSSPGESWPCAR